MGGPSWLAGTFAAVMILTAAYSAGRLAISRLRRRAIETDADAVHAVMGTAMAGMLVPRLNVLPDSVWAAVFGLAAGWFGWHAIRGRGLGISGASRCRYPVPHLIECAAMLYMLLPAVGSRAARGGAAMAMSGMRAPTGPAGSFPALAVVLALFMAGYIVWTTDRLTTLARAKTTANPGIIRNHQPKVTVAAVPGRHNPARAPATPSAAGTRHDNPADRPMLAPKLAACCKIAMSIAMGYMLILML
jgi:Domain of unknown function (DUF5134)